MSLSDVTSTSCKLTWNPPRYDGGSPLTGYYVEMYNNSSWDLIHTTSLDTVSAVPLLSTAVPVRSGDLQLRIYAKNAAAVGRPFEHTYNGIYAVFF